MSKYKLICSISAVFAVVAGFMLSFWPLTLLGLLLAAGSGQYVLAIGIGIVLDAAFGPPVGYLAFLHVPFMLLSICISILYYFLSVYFREGDSLHI